MALTQTLFPRGFILQCVQTFIIKGKEFCIQEAQWILANLIYKGQFKQTVGLPW